MGPSPHSALPLVPRPNLEAYRKIAKDLVKAWKPDNPAAVREWAERWAATSQVDDIAQFAAARGRTLTGAQFVVARLHGFESWPKFAKHVTALAASGSPVSRFEAAADSISDGELATLNRLLGEEPELVRACSTREHGATLLHYISANGVEDFRQRTPPNVVEIAAALLDAGAEVDTPANVYGGGCTALDLTATSIHPERAGVLEALLDLLLGRGARIGPNAVNDALANGRAQAAGFLAGRGAPLDFAAAAGLGRLDLARALFPAATEDQRRNGLLYASQYGRNEVIEFLIENGADLAVHDANGQTPLHWAVIGGHLDTVEMLLRHNPPLEAKNGYGGTVYGQALWSGAPDAIVEALLAAGARRSA